MLWGGTIEWSGSTDEVLQNGRYDVTVEPQRAGALFQGLMKLASGAALSGDVDNDDGKTAADGTVVPSDLVPVALTTGTYKVEWTVTGEAGSCVGSGFVTITDNPMSSVTW